MRVRPFLLLAMACPLLVTAVSATRAARAGDVPAVIEWLTDLDAARAKAKEEGRPLLVVFR